MSSAKWSSHKAAIYSILLPGPTSPGIFFLEIPSELGAHCVFLFLFFLTGDVTDI